MIFNKKLESKKIRYESPAKRVNSNFQHHMKYVGLRGKTVCSVSPNNSTAKLRFCSGVIYIIFSFFFFTSYLYCEVLFIEDTNFVLEPPVGWNILEVSDSRWTFEDFTKDAFMQIKIFEGNKYNSASLLCNSMMDKINAKGTIDNFNYYGRQAIFVFMDFSKNGVPFSGYGFFADGQDFDLAIISFATSESVVKLNDYILSALDSFALSPEAMNRPGPVSVYYEQTFGDKRPIEANVLINNNRISWSIDQFSVETSQLTIEREATILADYKPETDSGKEAWQRYYRMVYRDNYSRFDYLANLIKQSTNKNDFKHIHINLLKWIQGFDYLRTGGTSDLLSPLSAVAYSKGDCDSRAFLYVILLNHYKIDSALMVSSEYGHAMAAVDVKDDGARISNDGKMFLVAETTESVEIGMIASSMADPDKWLIIPLYQEEPWH